MALPKFLQSFLPSYDISKMDLRDPDDKKLIIEAVLNRGTMKDIKWLFSTYSMREVKSIVRHPSRGCWQERKLNYWIRILNVKIPKFVYDVALFSLHPRPNVASRFFRLAKQKQ